jgi:hypothetical protein
MFVAKTHPPQLRRPRSLLPVLLLVILLAPGCAKSPRALLSPSADSARPTLKTRLTLAPASNGQFTARLLLDRLGGDGQLFYALDPSAKGEITWQAAASSAVTLTLARRNAPYVVVAKTVSKGGLSSTVERIVFTADNVVAQAMIVSPHPTHQLPISTPPDFTVRWTGTDPEAPNGVPVGYFTRLVTSQDINPANPSGITQAMVQEYFTSDLASNRSAWLETAEVQQALSGLVPTQIYFFAVVAKDVGGDPGAVESFFDLDRNVLQFRPTLNALGPYLTVFNALFYMTKTAPSLDPTPRITLPLKAGDTMDFHWFGTPGAGLELDGFRWALDIADVNDETARRNARDLEHWTDWSLTTLGTTVGPFPAGDAAKGGHRLYVEVRDSFGNKNLFVVQIDVLKKTRPTGDLLVVDDLYGTATGKNAAGSVPYINPYPMEAEQDSFYYAVGGFPDSLRILGTPGADPTAISQAGAFAGFDYDTLDYRFWPEVGVSVLAQYRAVAWYTDQNSAARSGGKFQSATPATALRAINAVNQLNQLAAYVANGGKLWLFGDGSTTAIANGYYTRIATGAPRLPYTSGDDPRNDILVPGNFLYDFCHLRSELNTAGTPVVTLTRDQQLQGAIPYLPEFAGPVVGGDRSHDPRIGPGAARTALRWSGLPRLTLASYRSANPDPAQRSINLTWVITKPLFVTEGSGNRTESVLDTLYLCQARVFDPDHVAVPPSDGFPNAVDYHGSEHGEVVWFGFPLYYFERDQARQVVQAVMRVFGIAPLPPGVKQGPGTPPTPAPLSGEAQPLAIRAR